MVRYKMDKFRCICTPDKFGDKQEEEQAMAETMTPTATHKSALNPEFDKSSDLWKRLVRHLDIMKEAEVMSMAGSPEDIGNLDDLDDEDELDRAGGEFFEPVIPKLELEGFEPLKTAEIESIMSKLRWRELPSGELAIRLVDQMRAHLWQDCEVMVRLPRPKDRLIIVGDLHGHINDLIHLFDTYGEPVRDARQFLFNGDFVDRGVWGPEVVLWIFCLRLLWPEDVFLNRGNHESVICTETYGFNHHLRHAFPQHYQDLYPRILDAFNALPLCHIVGNEVFVVHGGLPAHHVSLSDIMNIQRGPVPDPWKTKKDRTFQAFLWSDPKLVSGASSRGMGWHFSENLTKRFLSGNGLKCMVRSHECVHHGFSEHHSGLVKTVFTASNYDEDNNAAVAIIDHDLAVFSGGEWNEIYKVDMEVGVPTNTRGQRSSWGAVYAQKMMVDSIRERLGDDIYEWRCTAHERVMAQVGSMVFNAKPQLLEAFEIADDNQCGRISGAQWQQVMAECLRTPPEFPWEELGPYIHKTDREDGNIPYAEMLLRFYNPLTAWLSVRWCEAVVDQIAYRIKGKCAEVFDELDKDGNGVLSYANLRTLVKVVFDEKAATTKTMALLQAVRVYALFKTMDYEKNGTVSRQEFIDALNRHSSTGADTQCLEGHTLMYDTPTCFQGRIYKTVCDSCRREIARDEIRGHCDVCYFDVCSQCQEKWKTSALQNVEKSKKEQQLLQSEWDTTELALRSLCASHVNVRALFSMADKVDSESDGSVDQETFVKIVSELLQGDEDSAEILYAKIDNFVKSMRDPEERRKTTHSTFNLDMLGGTLIGRSSSRFSNFSDVGLDVTDISKLAQPKSGKAKKLTVDDIVWCLTIRDRQRESDQRTTLTPFGLANQPPGFPIQKQPGAVRANTGASRMTLPDTGASHPLIASRRMSPPPQPRRMSPPPQRRRSDQP